MTNAYVGNNQVVKIMMGDNLVWQLVRSIGFVRGFIQANSTAEQLSSYVSAITSEWMPVLPSTNYRLSFSHSDRRRIQSKNASGVITYMASQSAETSADGFVVTTASDATLIRVYFFTNYNGSQDISISITRA